MTRIVSKVYLHTILKYTIWQYEFKRASKFEYGSDKAVGAELTDTSLDFKISPELAKPSLVRSSLCYQKRVSLHYVI